MLASEIASGVGAFVILPNLRSIATEVLRGWVGPSAGATDTGGDVNFAEIQIEVAEPGGSALAR